MDDILTKNLDNAKHAPHDSRHHVVESYWFYWDGVLGFRCWISASSEKKPWGV